MRIGLTGNTGFLGNILNNVLSADHEIHSIGRRDASFLYDFKSVISTFPSAEIIVHCAGKAHVPPNKNQQNDFFTVNVSYTENLLNSISVSKKLPNSFILISSVSVYGQDFGYSINEDHPLNATDDYGLSKIHAENLVKEWCKKNNVICTILRLPLVVGQNPPGNLGAMIKGIQKGYYFNIAGGKAKKSMVLASDIANAILKVAAIGGIYNLTDGHHPSFSEISNCISFQLNKNRPLNMCLWLAKLAAYFGDFLGSNALLNTNKLRKIISDLTFNDSKARASFGWNPTPVLEGFKISIIN